MSKFNETVTDKTVNKEGLPAYKLDAKTNLTFKVLTSFYGEDKFYGDNSDELVELAKEVSKSDPKFVANLALYARKEFNMRSVSHVLTVILANTLEGKPLVRQLLNDVILRVDDMTEILACQLEMFGKPIPNSMKKGLADSLSKFDEYQFAKYKGKNKAVKLKDILGLTRPKPKDSVQDELFGKIKNDTLETPYTWETELSAKGNNAETWEGLIDSKKLPYMASLRNIRNVVKANPSNIDDFFSYIENPVAIKNSKQLPFRFLSAYLSNKNESSKVLGVIENALDISVENVETIKGKTAWFADTSGSMNSNISRKSDVTCSDISGLLASIGNKISEDAYVFTFDTKVNKASVSTNDSVLSSFKSLRFTGGGTDVGATVRYLNDNKIYVDRIVILSDNENNASLSGCWSYFSRTNLMEEINKYRKDINPNVWVHLVDLQGYGTVQAKGEKINLITGWSEKLLQFIPLVETGADNLVKTVSTYMY